MALLNAIKELLGWVDADVEEDSIVIEGDNGVIDAEVSVDLTELQGVGPSYAQTLEAFGYESVEDVVDATHNELTDIDGVGDAKAEVIAHSAQEIYNENT
jgi:predicted flap endonuclease-1-like 5' DNA nuclease